jgi:alpha-1,3-rhamnosyltransferase
MPNSGLVSVIIPSYNHAKYVAGAILSVFNQTYFNIELIVIDDGSIDGSIKVIEDLRSRYSFIFIKRPNKGLSFTLNEGIRLSSGEFVCLLASDDLYLEAKIEKQVEFLNHHPEISMCFTNAIEINDEGIDSNKIFEIPDEINFYQLLLRNPIVASSVMIRASTFDNVGLFDEKLKVEDWDMWLRILSKFKINGIPEELTKYRIHSSNASSNVYTLLADGITVLTKWKSIPDAKLALDSLYSTAPLALAKTGSIHYLKFWLKYFQHLNFISIFSTFHIFLFNCSKKIIKNSLPKKIRFK